MATKKKGPEPITAATIRNLNDKLYDKRKLGAVEVEVQVRELARSATGHDKLVEILTYLQESFIVAGSTSSRKGGLIAFAAAALGLGGVVDKYLELLVPPVMMCLEDADNKVRYYACESLFNITKVTRGGVLPYFNEIFGHLCTLAADPDPNVRSAAELLDNLIKEIVTERKTFDVPKFVNEMLAKRIYVTNAEARKFLVSWIMVLDAVPDMDLVQYLPQFLDGLFKMLSDPSDEMRRTVVTCLFELLKEMHIKPAKVDFASLVPILVPQCNVNDQYQHVTSLTAMSWVQETIASGKEQILSLCGDLLLGILPGVSHGAAGVEDVARKANTTLVELVKSTSEEIPVKAILLAIQSQFAHQRVPTRLAALGWVLALQKRCATQLMTHIPELFPVLIKMLTDAAEDVVRYDLKVLSTLSSSDETIFNTLIDSILVLFRVDRKLLEHRGNLIVRQLALNMSAERIFRAFAKALDVQTDAKDFDFEFAATFIQTLNLILLTATELHDVRQQLKNLTDGHQDLFCCLYQSWSHNPAAVLSLCLLSQAYQHASDLIIKFSELEVTVSFLVEIDKLIQLLESPIYMCTQYFDLYHVYSSQLLSWPLLDGRLTKFPLFGDIEDLRLQLLEADKYPFLFKTLFGLLMLLPQSTAFETLKNRLATVTSLGVMQIMPKSSGSVPPVKGIDFPSLLTHFAALQQKHAAYIRAKRLAAEKVPSVTSSKKMHPSKSD